MKRGVMKDDLPGSLECFTELESLIGAVAAEARSGDHVLVMSNGGFGGIHKRLLDRLAREAAA
jgi:UDP-N-acetylmuramate-alanine ligase